MEKTKIKRLKQLLNEYILDSGINLDTPISKVYTKISNKYHELKLTSRKE